MDDKYQKAWDAAVSVIDSMITTYPHDWQRDMVRRIQDRMKEIERTYGISPRESDTEKVARQWGARQW